MKLTDQDQEKIKLWLSQRCGQMRCFCCGNARWTLVDVSSVLIGFNTHTTRFHYHEGMPQVTLGCETCGHLVNFAAVMIGLKPDQPPSEPIPATPAGA